MLASIQTSPQTRHVDGKSPEFVEMLSRKALQPGLAICSECQPDEARILAISRSSHQSCFRRAVDELYGAVVTQLEIVRDVGNGGACGFVMSFDDEEELVLGRGQA